MRVEQISVFLENKAGRLAEVTSILAEANINIRALSLADTSDFGVLRLIVNDNQKASDTLKNRGFTIGKTDVVAVEVEDRPGGLHKILEVLNSSQINVEYMYAFAPYSGDKAVMIGTAPIAHAGLASIRTLIILTISHGSRFASSRIWIALMACRT